MAAINIRSGRAHKHTPVTTHALRQRAGIPYALSTMGTTSPEKLAEASPATRRATSDWYGSSIANSAPVAVNDGYSVELSFFSPDRQYSIAGAPSQQPQTFGLAPGTVSSGSPTRTAASTTSICATGFRWA